MMRLFRENSVQDCFDRDDVGLNSKREHDCSRAEGGGHLYQMSVGQV